MVVCDYICEECRVYIREYCYCVLHIRLVLASKNVDAKFLGACIYIIYYWCLFKKYKLHDFQPNQYVYVRLFAYCLTFFHGGIRWFMVGHQCSLCEVFEGFVFNKDHVL